MYVFDTNAFSQLFHSYYRGRFPTLWVNFDELVANGVITSTREVAREIEGDRVEALREWARSRKELFPSPTSAEAEFVTRIFRFRHFQQIIEKRSFSRAGGMPIRSWSHAPHAWRRAS